MDEGYPGAQLEPIRIAEYTFHAQIADRWRVDQMSDFGRLEETGDVWAPWLLRRRFWSGLVRGAG